MKEPEGSGQEEDEDIYNQKPPTLYDITTYRAQSLQLTVLSLRPLLKRSWDTLLTVSSSDEEC